MKKIADLYGTCEHWSPGRDRRGRPLTSEKCVHCYYNLFAHCWYNERDDPVVISALNDDDECKRVLLARTGGL